MRSMAWAVVGLTLLLLGGGAVAGPIEKLRAVVSTDRAADVYAVGETATFSVSVFNRDGSPATNGVLTAVVDDFGTNRIFSTASFDLAKTNAFAVSGSLDRPGFLRLRLSGVPLEGPAQGNPDFFVWSAAFDPEKIEGQTPNPPDFDTYWAGEKVRLEREVPLDFRTRLCTNLTDAAKTTWYVSAATFNGKRVYGYLTVPTGDAKARPMSVMVPGAGFGNYSQRPWPQPGFIDLFMTVFPFSPDRDDIERMHPVFDRMEKSLAGRHNVKRYYHSGVENGRDGYFYHDAVLGINRVVDHVLAHYPVDRGNVSYAGTSQGGGVGLMLLALNGHFTRGAIYVPALTDFVRREYDGRRSGWPQFPEIFSGRPIVGEVVSAIAPYYDAVNFARRVTVPVRFAVGFSDTTCPPHAVYSAYNACASNDKAIEHGIGMAHGVFGALYRKLNAWAVAAESEE